MRHVGHLPRNYAKLAPPPQIIFIGMYSCEGNHAVTGCVQVVGYSEGQWIFVQLGHLTNKHVNSQLLNMTGLRQNHRPHSFFFPTTHPQQHSLQGDSSHSTKIIEPLQDFNKSKHHKYALNLICYCLW